MIILNIALTIFIILESLNVIILYFAPDFKQGNGVSVFKPWEKSKEDSAQHLFATYMVNWVAGSKLIFILLLIVILFKGDETLKLYALIAMIISIATYFWKLQPIIRKLDDMGEIEPKGYSYTLSKMISGFMLMFGIASLAYIFIY